MTWESLAAVLLMNAPGILILLAIALGATSDTRS